MNNTDFLPQPKKVHYYEEWIDTPEVIRLTFAGGSRACDVIHEQLEQEFSKHGVSCSSEADETYEVILREDPTLELQAYHLRIGDAGIEIRGGDAAGVYYGIQTLRQIVRQHGRRLPLVFIQDVPDYAVRGVYHDISRGKVPKRRTLLALIEKLAHYKINHFQLYIEHTFAFKNHPEIWAGSDPLTHEDILALDAHCRLHHVDFVPSLSTFGHCYRVIRNERNKHLNELNIDATDRPFSFRDAMSHYTLDCGNEQSLGLVREMINEYAPLFETDKFNICCDETFDLGKGKNASEASRVGTGELYVGYLSKVVEQVRSVGKQPMFWGDVILNYPELLARLPEDSIVLHWDYSVNVSADKCQTLADSGLPYYVCSGDGWRVWMNMLNMNSLNISRFAHMGKEYGAAGFLNTDWGDIGHPNMLAGSYHSFVLGASCSWNVDSIVPGEFGAFDKIFSSFELGDPSGESVRLLRRVGALQRVAWGDISMWRDRSIDVPAAWRDSETGFPVEILNQDLHELQVAEKELVMVLRDLENVLGHSSPMDPYAADELLCASRGALLMLRVGIILKQTKERQPLDRMDVRALADELRRFELLVSELWHRRNRPSEYYRLKCDLLHVAETLDVMSKVGVARKD